MLKTNIDSKVDCLSPDGSDETVKPVETATVDDLAFALLGLNQQASALYREIDALRTVYDKARKAGALGAETAIDALIAAQGGER